MDSIYNILIFLPKNVSSFLQQKLLTFLFSKTIQHICVALDVNFNESLTNNVVSFEQLGPGPISPTRLFVFNFGKRKNRTGPWLDRREGATIR